MARFYFHLHNDIEIPDHEGKEFPDLEAAREWATFQARNLFGEMAKEYGRVVLSHRIDIENEQGQVLATIAFSDAVKVEP